MVKKYFNKLKLISFIFIIFFSILSVNILTSVEPDEILQNQEQEIRARNISKNIRCMVCQNQSIDDSNAPLARDLRILIRNKIKEGKSNAEIYNFLTDRYGDFILLKPALKYETIALWFLPFLFLMLGIFVIYQNNMKSKKFD